MKKRKKKSFVLYLCISPNPLPLGTHSSLKKKKKKYTVHPTQPGLLDVEIQGSAKTWGIFSHNLYGVPQEKSSIHTRGLSLPFHDSSINTQNTAPKSSVPIGDRGGGAIQFLKEVGNDGRF